MYKLTISILALLLSFSCFALVKPKSGQIESSIEIWKGIGTQDDDSTWSIKFSIAGDQYFIDYPSLNCGGKLVLTSISNNQYQFIEQLSYGKSICLDNGHVTIKINKNNTADYFYSHPVAIATGKLIRQ